MSAIDPTANLLTKLRNASLAKHATVDVPASKFSLRILELLKAEGFIRNVKPIGTAPHQQLHVYLKYGLNKRPAIVKIIRISCSGRRRYVGAAKLPRVLRGLGRAILSTSKGLMTDREARRQHLGGELLAYVW